MSWSECSCWEASVGFPFAFSCVQSIRRSRRNKRHPPELSQSLSGSEEINNLLHLGESCHSLSLSLLSPAAAFQGNGSVDTFIQDLALPFFHLGLLLWSLSVWWVREGDKLTTLLSLVQYFFGGEKGGRQPAALLGLQAALLSALGNLGALRLPYIESDDHGSADCSTGNPWQGAELGSCHIGQRLEHAIICVLLCCHWHGCYIRCTIQVKTDTCWQHLPFVCLWFWLKMCGTTSHSMTTQPDAWPAGICSSTAANGKPYTRQ